MEEMSIERVVLEEPQHPVTRQNSTTTATTATTPTTTTTPTVVFVNGIVPQILHVAAELEHVASWSVRAHGGPDAEILNARVDERDLTLCSQLGLCLQRIAKL